MNKLIFMMRIQQARDHIRKGNEKQIEESANQRVKLTVATVPVLVQVYV